jgi:hypothetical protein
MLSTRLERDAPAVIMTAFGGLRTAPAQESPVMNEIILTLVEGELRIRDIDLAKRFGFERPRNIRNLVALHGEALLKAIVGKGQRALTKETLRVTGRLEALSCPFSRAPDAKSHPAFLFRLMD